MKVDVYYDTSTFFLVTIYFLPLFVIQTTEGRKNLGYIYVYTHHCVSEILRFALNDILKSIISYPADAGSQHPSPTSAFHPG